MTIQTLQKKLRKIKALGFVKTHRKGDTGVGKTLEDLLEIKENNIPLPDIGEGTRPVKFQKIQKIFKTFSRLLSVFHTFLFQSSVGD